MTDPVSTLMAPWAQLGIVGAVVMALGWAVWHLWHKLQEQHTAYIAEVKSCAHEMRELVASKIQSEHKMADALEGLRDVIDAMKR
jgi:hypothetical protein